MQITTPEIFLSNVIASFGRYSIKTCDAFAKCIEKKSEIKRTCFRIIKKYKNYYKRYLP